MPAIYLRMAAVILAFGALLMALRQLQARWAPHPEIIRKLLHVGMGLVALSFPWLFPERWPVLVLAGFSLLILLGLKWVAPLKQNYGQVIDGVGRHSLGDFFYPAAIGTIFYLSHGHPILFGIPVLVLALADAVGALIGGRYGLVHYDTLDGHKSVEGSVAFFTVAFLSTHIPLLLATSTGRAESLLIGLTLGLLIMLMEAVAWRGLDNLFIPIGSYLLLKNYLELDLLTLVGRFSAALALVFLVLSWRRHATLNHCALVSAMLFGYACWALGGWPWLVGPVTFYLSYTLLSPLVGKQAPQVSLNALLSVTSMALACLFLAKTHPAWDLFYIYTLSLAIHLCLVVLVRLKFNYPKTSLLLLLGAAIGKSWLLIVLPLALLRGFSYMILLQIGIAFPILVLAALAFYFSQPKIEDYPVDHERWIRQAIIAAGSACLGLVTIF